MAVNKNIIIRESLVRYLAETQNNLENAKSKIDKAKRLKDFFAVATFRGYKKVLENKIRDIAKVLTEVEKEITKSNFPNNEFLLSKKKTSLDKFIEQNKELIMESGKRLAERMKTI